MSKKLELIITLKEAEREYDIVYLLIMKALNKFGRYADMKDQAERYIVTKRAIKKQLKSYEQ